MEETAQALVDIVRQGKALYIGLSKYPADKGEQMCELLEEQHVKCLIYQDRYNMLSRNPETQHFDFIRKEGLGFIAFSPLAQGLLTNRYLHGIPEDSRVVKSGVFLHREDITPALVGKISRLNDIAAQRGQTLAEMSLSWLLSKEGLTSVIIGASSEKQLCDNIKAVDNMVFTAEELHIIDSIINNE